MPRQLLTAAQLGALTLPNRIVMAPMTRNRAPQTVAGELNAIYYTQRASAGLIITEGTQISRLGQGYPDTPGIFSEEQIKGWRTVTNAVHAAGGRIFAQLWHVGRVSHSIYHGEQPVAPSPIAPAGEIYTPGGMLPFETPRALSSTEVREIVAEFQHAARCAMEAGFDGVEIHGANGYLIDQFLRSSTNRRADGYGGSVQKRARFLLEVVEAVVKIWDADRVGVRLSPTLAFNDMHDDDPIETFSYVARALEPYKLAYIHVIDEVISTSQHEEELSTTQLIRNSYTGTLISCGGYSLEAAERALHDGRADLIAFGRPWIANPDLVLRFAIDAAIREPERATFYGGNETGYIDYPLIGMAQRTA